MERMKLAFNKNDFVLSECSFNMSNVPGMPNVPVSENITDSDIVSNNAESNNTPNMPNMPTVAVVETNTPQHAEQPVALAPEVSGEPPQPMSEMVLEEIDAKLSESNTPIHSFNPEDSPEEKAKKTKEAAGTVLSNKPPSSDPIVPKSIIRDGPKESLRRQSTASTIRSTISTDSASAIVGWKQSNESFLESSSGQEWTNALCLVVVVLVTYVIAKLGLGLGWCLIVLIFVAQYYINSVKRFRRNARDDITRQLCVTKLLTDTESTEWLNTFLSKFWLIYEPVLSATIVGITDGILAVSTPGFLDSLRLTEFTLGTKAPRVESVKTFTNDDDETVEMEWDVSFTPNDLEDLTQRQLRNKTNPKIVLEVRVGKGFVGAGMPILVEDISFRGRMRVKMRLMTNFPHMQSVDLCFMEPPSIDYILKPIGGETFGFDISHIPGLSTFIKEQIHAVLGPMMYNPNVFSLNMEQLMSGVDTEAAIGVLRVHIRHARNLKNLEVVGLSDPYVRLNINKRAELGRTTYKQNTLNPSWDETFFILIHDLNETLSLEVFDKEEIKKDRSLGTATFNMASLQDEPDQDNIIAKVIRERGKEHGEVCFDANYYPVIEPVIEEDGTATQVESNHGILKVVVHQAKDLDSKASTKLNPYGVVQLNGAKILATKVLKRKASPVWEDSIETFISDKSTAVLTIDVRDERGLAVDPHLGKFSIGLNEALKRMEEQNQWFNLNGHASGKVRLSFIWKPVEIKGGVLAPGHLATPIGVIRLDIVGAKNLKNVERIGKSDPYVIISVSGRPLSRTEVIDNNLNPTWNETHYIGVRSPREVVYFDVYDFDKVGKDRRLGSTSIPAQQIFGEQINENQWGPGAPQDLKLSLHLDGKERGEIHVKASFNTFVELNTESNSAEPKPESDDQLVENSEPSTDIVELAQPIDYTQYSTGLLSVLVGNTKDMRRRTEPVYAEVLLNNNEYNVVHRTKPKKRALNPKFDEECEVFIQEAQFATITIYLREMNDERSIVARRTIDLPTILEQLSNGSPEDGFWYEFENTDGKIQLKLKFSPVEIQIDESESWINKGLVIVKILKAQGLRAADASGTSDPFIVVSLNGERVHKTKVVKKTLSPVFNEEFTVLIHARNEAALVFDVYDWNQVQTSEELGYFQISTKNLEPLTWIQDDYNLIDGTGSVSLKIMFRPEHVGRMTSDRKQTFQSATKSVLGKGVGGATRAVGGTLGGISKGVSGLLSLGKKSNRSSISAPRPNINMPQEASSTRSNSISSGYSNVLNSPDTPNISEIPNMPNMPITPTDSAFSQASIDDIKTPITPVSPKFNLNVEDEPTTNVDNNIDEPKAKRDLSALFKQVGGQLANGSPKVSSPSSINEPELSLNSRSVPQSPNTDVSYNRSSILDGLSQFSGESGGLDNYNEDTLGEHGFLTVEILKATDLIAANSNGLSNPYVRVRSGRKMLFKTKVCKKTLEPTWNERFTIPISGSSAKLNFSVRDRNLLQDNYLGEYETNVLEHIQLHSQAEEEKWVQLNKTDRGKLLLKFSFISNNSPRSCEVFDSLSGSAKKKLGFSTFRRKS